MPGRRAICAKALKQNKPGRVRKHKLFSLVEKLRALASESSNGLEEGEINRIIT